MRQDIQEVSRSVSTHTLFLIEELSVSNIITEKVDKTGHTGGQQVSVYTYLVSDRRAVCE